MTRNAELTHLFRAMKAPAAARALPNLAERAREEEWRYERFAEALLSTEVSSRESSGGRLRIRAARFPAHKTLEEFDFTFQRSRQEAGDRAPRTTRLPARQAERDPARPARDRQDHISIALGGPRVPRRPAGPVPHRDRMGRAAGRRATPRTSSTRNSPAWSGSRCWSATCADIATMPTSSSRPG